MDNARSPLELIAARPLPGAPPLTLHVNPGQAVGVYAPNGTGKSTLLRAIVGLAPLHGGAITVGGSAPGSRAARRVVGWMPDRPSFPRWTCGALARVAAGLSSQPEAGPPLLDALGLSSNTFVSHLSHGEARRLAFALALIPRPAVLLLDEPFQGLDLTFRQEVAARVEAARARGAAILVVGPDPLDIAPLTDAREWA